MSIKPMPTLRVVEMCSVRTYRDRWERLTWLDLFCRGERGMSAAAW